MAYGRPSLDHHSRLQGLKRSAASHLRNAKACLRSRNRSCAVRELVEAAERIGEARSEVRGYGGDAAGELRNLQTSLWRIEKRVKGVPE